MGRVLSVTNFITTRTRFTSTMLPKCLVMRIRTLALLCEWQNVNKEVLPGQLGHFIWFFLFFFYYYCGCTKSPIYNWLKFVINFDR
ncbi:hypothetical protein CDL12_30374 [Handroanthus impetiginosus]|uniref:Uncharacterized protein n=1 Tax=Handroanthus impetiginosus TaxID=429701 RepID=A0A2G9FVQ5_9LAMI|nr:hypothetical protein CDL12_30374 [Handroanthus impetiginosus]